MSARPEAYPHGAYFEADSGDPTDPVTYVPRMPFPDITGHGLDSEYAAEWEADEESKGEA